MKPFKNRLKFSTIQVVVLCIGRSAEDVPELLTFISKTYVKYICSKVEEGLRGLSGWSIEMLRSIKIKSDGFLTSRNKNN